LDQAASAIFAPHFEQAVFPNTAQLSAAEDTVYNEAMATLTPKQKETALDLSNEWTAKGARETLLFALERRFGKVPAMLSRRISRLWEPLIHDMVVAAFDFKKIGDAEAWITGIKARG
jgi:hypothetical protein